MDSIGHLYKMCTFFFYLSMFVHHLVQWTCLFFIFYKYSDVFVYVHKLSYANCRDSTEEPMELSEEERNELMKKESSRLLKTGHRVSYSPRKEKALKIYLDGGPSKDLGQD